MYDCEQRKTTRDVANRCNLQIYIKLTWYVVSNCRNNVLLLEIEMQNRSSKWCKWAKPIRDLWVYERVVATVVFFRPCVQSFDRFRAFASISEKKPFKTFLISKRVDDDSETSTVSDDSSDSRDCTDAGKDANTSVRRLHVSTSVCSSCGRGRRECAHQGCNDLTQVGESLFFVALPRVILLKLYFICLNGRVKSYGNVIPK